MPERLVAVCSGGNDVRDALGDRLVQLDRPDDVPEPVWAQVAQRDARRELRDEPDRRARQEHLATLGDPEQPGHVVEGHPEQLVAQVGDLAGVDRHPDPDGHAVRPPFHRQGALRLDGRGHGAARRAEQEHAAVAAGGVSRPSVGSRRRPEDRALALEDREEGIPERAEEARGAFHVGVDQRHNPLVPHGAQRDATGTYRQRDCPVSRRHWECSSALAPLAAQLFSSASARRIQPGMPRVRNCRSAASRSGRARSGSPAAPRRAYMSASS